jgi:hypothetical protein
MTIRLIDLATMKKNPTAGKNLYLENWGPVTVREVFINGVLTEREETRHVVPVRTMQGEPEWLYEYEPCICTCRACGRKFEFNQLKDAEWDGDDGSFEVCPYCDEWDCLTEEVENETVEEALNRGDDPKAKCRKCDGAVPSPECPGCGTLNWWWCGACDKHYCNTCTPDHGHKAESK